MSANQVYMWHLRRARNGFPAAVSHTTKGPGARPGKPVPLFDLDEVTAWKAQYVPSKGGQPMHARNRS